MSEVNVEALLRERQNLFIESRTKIEREVTMFLSSLEKINDELIPNQVSLRGKTAKDILPSLWADPFVKTDYQKDLEAFNAHVLEVRMLANKLNGEALKCLQGLQ